MFRELLGQCSVHRTRLLRAEVPVRYGLIRSPASLISARRREFPNARSFALGGCLVWEGRPTTQQVRYCQACRESESAWHLAHPRGE